MNIRYCKLKKLLAHGETYLYRSRKKTVSACFTVTFLM